MRLCEMVRRFLQIAQILLVVRLCTGFDVKPTVERKIDDEIVVGLLSRRKYVTNAYSTLPGLTQDPLVI